MLHYNKYIVAIVQLEATYCQFFSIYVVNAINDANSAKSVFTQGADNWCICSVAWDFQAHPQHCSVL
jgi:hypothetical protein